MRGAVDELELRQRRAAQLARELVEVRVHVAVHAAVLVPELLPARAVVRGIAGEDRRQLRVGHLERVAGRDPHPRAVGRDHGREADDVVLDDHVGTQLVEDLAEAVVDVLRPAHERLPGRADEALELLDRGLAEHRARVADEVLPELARLLLGLGGRLEPHQPLLEALLLERAGERLLDHEDHPVPAPPQRVADPHAVVRGPVGPLREEDDRAHGSDPGQPAAPAAARCAVRRRTR